MSALIQNFSKLLNEQLNPQQYQAVTAERGALLVLAGAGSGKTRVITARIANLMLNHGINGSQIIALTFTNKAAREMKERVNNFIGGGVPMPFIGTFHSFCLKLLKEHGTALGLGQFTLLDSDDQYKLISQILTKHGLQKQFTPRNAQHSISLIKNRWGALSANPGIEPLLFSLYQTYESEKKISRLLDFDDLLGYTVDYLKNKPQFAQELRSRLKHILVDEYQDTNVIQHELLRLLAKDNETTTATSVCVVGDEDQSIYSWRGATVENIAQFCIDFPGAQRIKIEQNYRSVQGILSVANNVISNNTSRYPKQLWSARTGDNRILKLTCATDYQEGEVVAQLAQAFGSSRSLSEIAVLYRTHAQSRALEEILLRNQIPYVIVGGIQFYERREIKDLLAYLKLITNQRDRISLGRILNVPRRKLGPAVEDAIALEWQSDIFASATQIIDRLLTTGSITGQKKTALADFAELINSYNAEDNPYTVLQSIIERTGYLTYLKEEFDKDEADTKIQNVHELLRAVDYFTQQGIETVAALLDEVGLMQDLLHDNDGKNSRVQLMTFHAAKGLEFHTVVITGLEEGVLPSSRAFFEQAEMEEERRLMYVGITRACDYLIMTHARHRYTFGQMSYQEPSRFFEEMPPAPFIEQDISFWRPMQINDYLRQFITNKIQQPVQRIVTAIKAPVAPSSSALPPQPVQSKSGWKQQDIVHHEVFGQGTVQIIDEKSDGTTYLTIRFRSGIKKISSQFVQRA